MHTRRELVGLAVGLVGAPALVEAAEKKPRFEEYVSKMLGDFSAAMTDQNTMLSDVKDLLETLKSELDNTEALLGNTRLLDALQAALTELNASCQTDHA